MLEMNNQPQQKMDSADGQAHPAQVRSVTADIERLTETMAMLETYVDGLLERTQKVAGAIRGSSK
jgi:hypothetical protein